MSNRPSLYTTVLIPLLIIKGCTTSKEKSLYKNVTQNTVVEQKTVVLRVALRSRSKKDVVKIKHEIQRLVKGDK